MKHVPLFATGSFAIVALTAFLAVGPAQGQGMNHGMMGSDNERGMMRDNGNHAMSGAIHHSGNDGSGHNHGMTGHDDHMIGADK
ncbi:MAG: hypothetical protein AB7U75_20960 [Hyphomicrobiaceae bacterium]